MARLYPIHGPVIAPILFIHGAAQFHRTNGHLKTPRRDKRKNHKRVLNEEIGGERW